MKKYCAWQTLNGKRVRTIHFSAKSLLSAKRHATQELVVQYGTWHEGTIFLPDGTQTQGWTKALKGKDGATGLYPRIEMIEKEKNNG